MSKRKHKSFRGNGEMGEREKKGSMEKKIRRKPTHIQFKEELDYLINETTRNTSSLLAEAVEEGVHLMFRRYISEAYMSDKIDHDKAIQLIGASAVQELDEAWSAVEKDIKWGLKDD